MKWTEASIKCYKRQLLGYIHNYNPCKILINSSCCENTIISCKMLASVKEIYSLIGPPEDLPTMPNWQKKKVIHGLRPFEVKVIEILEKCKKPVSKEVLGSRIGIQAQGVPSVVSDINKKRPNSIIITKNKRKSVYSIRTGGF